MRQPEQVTAQLRTGSNANTLTGRVAAVPGRCVSRCTHHYNAPRPGRLPHLGRRWGDYAGPGTIEYTTARFPTGIHPMPKTWSSTGPETSPPPILPPWPPGGAAGNASPACSRRSRRRVSTGSSAAWPRWTRVHRLRATVAWLGIHPTSGLLLRQLPIEGIGTKWLAHAVLVLALLGDPDFPDKRQARTTCRHRARYACTSGSGYVSSQPSSRWPS